jgi:hypothetical protein
MIFVGLSNSATLYGSPLTPHSTIRLSSPTVAT